MNERIDNSKKKNHSVEAPDAKDEKIFAKRRRGLNDESVDTESPKKIMKKLSKPDVSIEKNVDVRSFEKSSNKNRVDCADKTNINDDEDFADDSVLLDDLFTDFHEEIPSSGVSLCKENSAIGKITAEKSSKDSGNSSQKTENSEEFAENNETNATSAAAQLEAEFDGEFVDFFDEPFHENNDANSVDFEEFRYCKIIDVERQKKFTKIRVKDSEHSADIAILCYDFWRDIDVEEGDVVSLQAKKESDNWVIDNNNGFVVTKPHNLMTGTAIVGANWCLRRGVLESSFRGLDSLPSGEPRDGSMVIGTLIHEVLQKTLKTKASTIPKISEIVDEIISTPKAIQSLYESDVSLRDCRSQLKTFVPKIFNFVDRYILGNVGNTAKDKNFKGKIERIREIEENVWLPSLGIRGKMDVTVDVTHDLERKIMPLEVKTGKASFSSEHRGQVILYNMMLRYTGHKVHSGLLLYIRENVMQEIATRHSEERDLILLRNSLANYITQGPKFEEITGEDGKIDKVWKPIELPEPIDHPFSCSKCPYNALCSVYADKDPNIELSKFHSLKTIHNAVMSYITTEHIDYILKWITIVQLEDNSKLETTSIGELWTTEPRVREDRGLCICNLKVCGTVEEKGSRYLHTFARRDNTEEYLLSDLSQSNFWDGEYILISTDTRVNVSAGYVNSKSKEKIELLLERNVVRQNPNAVFHLDKYPFMSNPTLSLANIASLLYDNEIVNKVRTIIVEKKSATFAQKLPKSVAEIGANILFRLNKYQRQAVLKVLAADDYMLIKGMPGTGKTQTLVALIDLLVKTGRTVLVTAHTHSAVDNILLKLDERGIDFVRLGSTGRINPSIMHKSEDVLTADCQTPESLDAVYKNKKVVGVTCLSASHGLLMKRIFDVCLVDEATQVTQSVVLRPLYGAKKFVLVGDPEQLPPIVRSSEAKKLGMKETLFHRLDSENNTVTLKLQYRMNRKIMSVSNEITYNGKMKAANEDVASATLHLKDPMVLESCERWVSKALSLNLKDSVVVLDTGDTYTLNSQYDVENKCRKEDWRVRNVFEAVIVLRLITALLKGGVDKNSIGVICPFVLQVELMRSICPEIEVNTVDQYQGRDKEIILYSCTRSWSRNYQEPSNYEILQDRHRLNVAVTRAKHKLIIVGDKRSLEYYAPFKKLFDVVKDEIVDLEPGRDDFSWENLLKLIE